MLLVCCYSVISMFLYNIYFVYVLYIYIFIYKTLERIVYRACSSIRKQHTPTL